MGGGANAEMAKWDSWRGCGVTLDGSEIGDVANVSPSP